MKCDCRKVEIGMVGEGSRKLAPSKVASRLAGIAVHDSRAVSLRQGLLNRKPWIFFYRGELPKNSNNKVDMMKLRGRVSRFKESLPQGGIVRRG